MRTWINDTNHFLVQSSVGKTRGDLSLLQGGSTYQAPTSDNRKLIDQEQKVLTKRALRTRRIANLRPSVLHSPLSVFPSNMSQAIVSDVAEGGKHTEPSRTHHPSTSTGFLLHPSAFGFPFQCFSMDCKWASGGWETHRALAYPPSVHFSRFPATILLRVLHFNGKPSNIFENLEGLVFNVGKA